ncbi:MULTISPECIES: glycoside hydrolase family 140 protein [unclassified Imperialibacter]|uniref:glycoside hydrolase family 140 protein n=1 Tax=unclassified Imperialibacter TaxID=2629706 RepID=UPI0012583EBC|nr:MULTISPECIES: glycoside hydrolase family 140 protein [unclassified Imperialibacter]CAD5279516.1 conserved hypothetical protein [Imperialibacter sp. 75]CAD5288748.1 conserved hypothetical protein [Imperialibacter sp. 89]VVT16150.1 conserved hypothetical protein [Imperialibacter sp. EC-SDR9]
MKYLNVALSITGLLLIFGVAAKSQPLKVSDNKRFLVKEDGSPFFYLADTGWELFHRLDRNEVDYYLRNRASKGFTAIQAVILSEINGLTVPNAEGNLPLVDFDPSQPNEKYFELVDHVVKKAEEFGLYMALLPTWGAYAEDQPHPLFDNKMIFTESNARTYGEFLGKRYKDQWNVLWILGGDRVPTDKENIWNAMAEGLKKGAGNAHLISYHPSGQQTSSEWFHKTNWLDFNILQSGHQRFSDNVYTRVANDYNLTPPKPVLNGEPAYEDINEWFNPANPRYNDYEIRKYAYWSVFAGAFGHTYGNNNIWQMYTADVSPIIYANMPWNEALEQPGASQMQHLRNLMESRPFLTRIPDQSVIDQENYEYASDHMQATRDGQPGKKDATYIMAYLPMSRDLSIKTDVIDGRNLFVWWYSPVNGEAIPYGKVKNTGVFRISTWNVFVKENQPGPDWVIVIDDADKKYPAPGKK